MTAIVLPVSLGYSEGGTQESLSLAGWLSSDSLLVSRFYVVTVLLSPRYVGNLPRIFDYSPLDPTQDFNTQM